MFPLSVIPSVQPTLQHWTPPACQPLGRGWGEAKGGGGPLRWRNALDSVRPRVSTARPEKQNTSRKRSLAPPCHQNLGVLDFLISRKKYPTEDRKDLQLKTMSWKIPANQKGCEVRRAVIAAPLTVSPVLAGLAVRVWGRCAFCSLGEFVLPSPVVWRWKLSDVWATQDSHPAWYLKSKRQTVVFW